MQSGVAMAALWLAQAEPATVVNGDARRSGITPLISSAASEQRPALLVQLGRRPAGGHPWDWIGHNADYNLVVHQRHAAPPEHAVLG